MQAGEISVKVSIDSANFNNELKKLNTSINNVQDNTKKFGSEFIKAGLILEGLKAGFNLLTNVVKESVTAYNESVKAGKQLEAVLLSTKNAVGLSSNEIKKIASSFQEMTTFEDDAILSAQNLLLTFTNIKGNIFPQATEQVLNLSTAFGQDLKASAIQLGKALNDPIAGVSALRRVGVSLSEQQEQQVKSFMALNDIASAQNIILKELETEVGGSARAMKDTLGGAILSLQNQYGDLQENIGGVIESIGKDFITTLSNTVSAINNFMSSAEGMKTIETIINTITGVFSTLKVVFDNIYNTIKDNIIEMFDNLKKQLSELVDNGKGGTIVFTVFATVIKVLSSAFNILVSVLKLVINAVINTVTVIKEAAMTIGSFINAISKPFDKKNWEDLGDQVLKTFTSIKELGADIVKDTANVIITQVDSLKKLPSEVEKLSKQMESAWNSGFGSKKQNATTTQIIGTTQVQGNNTSIPTLDTKELEKSLNITVALYANADNQISNIVANMAGNITSSVSNITNSMLNMQKVLKDDNKAWEEKAIAVGGFVSSIASAVESSLQSMIGTIQQATNDFYNSQIESLQEKHNQEIESINERLNIELELIEYNGMTKQQYQQQEIATLQQKLAMETDAEKKAIIQKQIDEIKKEQAITAATKKADNEKAQSKFKLDMATYKLQKQQFEANKALQMVQATIAFALGLVQLWSTVWTIGNPIAAGILGGVMTGVLTGIYAAQMAIIGTSQFTGKPPTPPSFASGGIVPDNTIANVNRREMILNLEQQDQLFRMLNGQVAANTGQTINLIVDGDVLRTWNVNNNNRERYRY